MEKFFLFFPGYILMAISKRTMGILGVKINSPRIKKRRELSIESQNLKESYKINYSTLYVKLVYLQYFKFLRN